MMYPFLPFPTFLKNIKYANFDLSSLLAKNLSLNTSCMKRDRWLSPLIYPLKNKKYLICRSMMSTSMIFRRRLRGKENALLDPTPQSTCKDRNCKFCTFLILLTTNYFMTDTVLTLSYAKAN